MTLKDKANIITEQAKAGKGKKMLRSNTKKARENLRNYIIANYDGCGYDKAPENTAPFAEVAAFILKTQKEEWPHRGGNYQEEFVEWCAGLPSVLDTCYFYNRSAVDDLGGILEETEEEKARFTEEQAEKMLSRLIYMELKRAA